MSEGHAGYVLPELPEPGGGEPGPDGATPGYRARHTLRLRVELARQLRRRRTQVALGLLAALPLLLLAAFELGADDRNRRSGGLVDLATASGANFVSFALFASASFLFVVVVALFFGDTVASEASWSSLKYLLAIPVPRHRLLRQKAVVSGVLSLLGLVLLPLVALGAGALWYGVGELATPTGEALPFGTAVFRLAVAVAYLAVHLSWVAGLALLLSVSTDAPLGAVGGAVLASILSQILDSITALGDLRVYLPTHYSFAWSDVLTAEVDWTDMARGAFSAVAYAAVFLLLAGRRFATKDITS
ncbi:ABC transporter permease [Streptoalloteichus hindustanus]|uniref:ABC-2 type transport system permease protein n=1 Tax=Streptoalloteichus hindustanus TaxID=2017 RepID=A0A1M5HEQ1_STRHI|nr:ABC transporter permease subunit [Streptoalloteichus hindustanus]SHG14411.1 ABC-2 type transport system permease protein [Streptoalloteichus hindustanus]